jgi:hypothetical protein
VERPPKQLPGTITKPILLPLVVFTVSKLQLLPLLLLLLQQASFTKQWRE